MVTDILSLPPSISNKLERMSEREFARIMQDPADHSSARELFRDACAMTRARIAPDDQKVVLRARFFRYYRPLEEREIENAINAASTAPEHSGPRWPKPSEVEIRAVVTGCENALNRLREQSPCKTPGNLASGAIIDRLFGRDDLLCFGTADFQSVTEPRNYFLGDEENFPLIVPNVMTAKLGKTRTGRDSPRTLSNVGPRTYAVIEFDHGALDEQAAILLHLNTVAPLLRQVVYSGSKSLHGWFDVRNVAPSVSDQFLRYAAFLGADTATFNPVQLVRMPNAWRDESRKQTVEYLSNQ